MVLSASLNQISAKFHEISNFHVALYCITINLLKCYDCFI